MAASHDGVTEMVDNEREFLPHAEAAGTKRLRSPLNADLVDSLRTAAASLVVPNRRSAQLSDTDSDDELLMDVEVRTSGPDSGLLTNKSEIRDDDDDDDDDDDELCAYLTKSGSYTEPVSVKDVCNSKRNVPEISTEQTHNSHEPGKFTKLNGFFVGKKTEFGDLPCNGHSKQSTELEIHVANFIRSAAESAGNINSFKFNQDNKNEFYQNPRTSSAESAGNINSFKFNQDNKNEFYQNTRTSTNDSIASVHSNIHTLIKCENSSKSPTDNHISELIESALVDEGTNVKTIMPKAVDPNSNSIRGVNESNDYNSGQFPRLKQMLTKGLVSDATLQFTKAMAMDKCTDQGLNYIDTSTNHNGIQTHSTAEISDQRHSLNETGTNQPTGSKRCMVTDSDAIFDEGRCLPPKKSKCFASPYKHVSSYSSGLDSTFVQLFENQSKHVEDTTEVEIIHGQDTCWAPETKVPPPCSRRPCTQRVAPPPPLLPPCRVSGEKASGFHYGVNTCEACKGFFRRSLCRKEPYVCVSNGDCEVQSGRRTVCSHCRLKRCLDVGMSKNAIKTGRYTHELRSKNIMEVKQLQRRKERGTTSTVSEPFLPQIKDPECAAKAPASPVNGELHDALEKILMAQTHLFEFLDDYYDADLILKRQMEVYNRFKKEKFERLKIRASNSQLSPASENRFKSSDHIENNEISENAPSEPIKKQVIENMIEDMERGIQGLVMFAKNVPGFSDLDVDDQSALLKVARFDIWYIGHIRCLNSTLRVGACEWYFHAEELEKLWGPKLVDMCFRLTDYGQKLNLTREETAALRAVSLTFSDRCVLKNRKAVEDINAKMFEIFQYIASKRNPSFHKWLPDVINFLVYLRDFGIEFDNKSCKLNIEWPVIQRNPLLLEVFFT